MRSTRAGLSGALLLVSLLSGLVQTQKLAGYADGGQRVCDSMDIRNRVEEFKALEGCTVIVGFLRILLLDSATEEDFRNLSFPALIEVTDYFLLYRVRGLATLSLLFPNLSIIRGNVLLVNYALVVYDVPNIQNIGLKSLTTIQRGAIRIEKNYELCYLESIDWNRITGREEVHYIKVNGNRTKCAKEVCSDRCPGQHCWNEKICQLTTTAEDNTNKNRCHKECLGGCDPITKDCFKCRNYNDHGNCVEKCPRDKYTVAESSYCVTAEECAKLYFSQSWIWEGTCRRTCPKGYQYVKKGAIKTCVQCLNNKCTKECPGSEVSSIDEAQSLRGCTIISGSLQIKLSGYQSKYIMKELEENLCDIEEIKGFLKIYRSLRITSLAFLRNLKLIGGNYLENGKSALLVYEMQNLQYLWHWNITKNLKIKRGGIFFHFNPKLCLGEIGNLMKVLGVNASIFEVSQKSNGYKIACRYDNLETSSRVLGKHNATITWGRYRQNTGPFLGYNIYYIESIDDEVTTEYAQDSCYEMSWSKEFVKEPTTEKPSRLTIVVNGLKPSTKYAYYVETISDKNENALYMSPALIEQSAQSVVKYFTTKADAPTPPWIVQTVSTSQSSISIYWINELKFDSLITRYVATVKMLFDEKTRLDERDYCVSALQLVKTNEIDPPFSTDDAEAVDGCECQIGRIHEQSKLSYYKNNDFSMIICETLESDVSSNSTCSSNAIDVNCGSHELDDVSIGNMYYLYTADIVAPANNHTFNNLRPYGKYVVSLRACIGNRKSGCGRETTTIHRVQRKYDSDDIIEFEVTVVKHSVDIYWYPPDFPNGADLAYNIQYSRTDIENHMPQTDCITRKDHELNDYSYHIDLTDGDYKVRVRTISLAGYGNYTEYYYFKVPEYGVSDNKAYLAVACFFVLIASAAVSFCCYKKRCDKRGSDRKHLLENMYVGARYNVHEEDAVEFVTESVLDYDRRDVWGYENRGAQF